MLGPLGDRREEKLDPSWQQMEARPPLTDGAVKQATQHHGVLCRLMVEGGVTAMREVFNMIHPPMNLRARLAKLQAFKTLERLHNKGVIHPTQWAALYPKHKEPNSENFDNILLHILLRQVCHLSPPYPNGWDGAPLVSDDGIAANLVRLDNIRHIICTKETIEEDAFYSLFEQITEAFCSIAGLSMRRKAEGISQEQLSEQQQRQFVQDLKEWESKVERNKLTTVVAEKVETIHSPLLPSMNLPQIQIPVHERVATRTHSEARSLTPVRTVTPGKDLFNGLLVPGLSREGTSSGLHSRRNSASNILGDFLAQDRTILIQYHKVLLNIRSDTVLPKLVKAGVLTHEEKNTINLVTRNIDRMKALLRVLPTKQRAAFGAFCDAIKFKYTALYDTLMKAKRIAMEKPDDITETNNSLRSSYKATMSRLTPIPWHPNGMIDIRDFYTPLYITNYHGRQWSPETLFEVTAWPKNGPEGRRIVLEGVSGSGKSTVCRYITTEWAYSTVPVAGCFRLVYYIEVKLLKNSLAETILEHNHEAGYNRTPADVYALINHFQKEVMFILDGLEDLSPKVTTEVMDLLHGYLFPNCSVVVTMNSTNMTDTLRDLFDTQVAVLGLMPHTQEAFVMRYAKLTKTPEELYTKLIDKFIGEGDGNNTSLQILALNPQLLMCMCLLCESECMLEAKSTTALLQAFFYGLQKLYCKRKNIQVINDTMPERLQILAQDIEEMAWRCMHQNGSFYMYDQTEDGAGAPMYMMGVLQRRTSSALSSLQQLFFTNRIFQDFMVARVLCRLKPEDFMEYVDSLVNNSYYSNVAQYFCGLLKDDYDTQRLSSIVSGLAAINTRQWRGYTASTTMGSAGELRSRRDRLLTPTITEGRFGDFVLSLECLNECEGRDDMRKIVADSLPVRIFTRHKKMITHSSILGMAYAVQVDTSMIIEMEMRLDHYARYNRRTLAILGKAINQSKTMAELKIHWSDSDLLSEVFAVIFQAPCNVSTVSCFDETKQLREHRISAVVWSNMKQAGHNMASIKNFSFANCRNKAMVTCILHSLPYTVENLSITDTSIDIVAAQALSKRIEMGRSLKTLDLAMVNICRPDFSHICAGLRLSSSLCQLWLAGTNLDVTSFIALAEALKFNRSLKQLDLGMTRISDTACRVLATSLNSNRQICEVFLDSTKMTHGGKQILITRTNQDVIYIGIETIEIVPLPCSTVTTRYGLVSVPMLKPRVAKRQRAATVQ